MSTKESFSALVSDLVGMKLSGIWQGHGSAISLEFGKLTPRPRKDGTEGNPWGEISVFIEWSWRIEDDQSIICGSWSEEENWQKVFDKMRDKKIKKLCLFGQLPELEITFEGGIRLLSFSTTDGQPQWHLIDYRDEPAQWFFVRDGLLYEGDGSEVD